jgi:hypothetical protein
MPHVNDCKLDYFETQLAKSGQLNDLMLEWLQAQPGVTAGTVNDAWSQLFDAATIPAGQFNDRYVAWLKAQGAVGETLNDLQFSYYCDTVIALVDTFTDTNGVLLQNHTPDKGGPWILRTADAGPPTSALTIQSNSLRISLSAEGAIANAAGADASIEIDMRYVTGRRGGLMMRSVSDGNTLSFRYRGPESAIEIVTWTAGTVATDVSGSFTFTTGQTYRLKAVCKGSTITCFIDGVQVLQGTVTAHAAGTGFGVTTYGSTSNDEFDNCVIYNL